MCKQIFGNKDSMWMRNEDASDEWEKSQEDDKADRAVSTAQPLQNASDEEADRTTMSKRQMQGS